MMNKKKTPWISLAKYMLFLPLAGVLFITNNSTAQELVKNPTDSDNKLPELVVVGYYPTPSQQTEVQDKKQDEPVFENVEQMPQFPGGVEKLMQYLSQNIKYPVSASQDSIQGTVTIKFIVDKEGNVSNPVVLRSVDSLLDKEAVRVISAMPQWIPGKQSGKSVSVYYTIPIRFRLNY